MKQPHILCDANDVGKYVILPGDPQRVVRAAAYLEDCQEVAFNREFRTIKGYYKGVAVTITSTGIGGPSTAIAVEELIDCGAKYFIRIGSGGAIQWNIEIGDLIIATAAVREDGASKMYVLENYPAVADIQLTYRILETCSRLKYKNHCGIIRSHDSFYIDNEEEIMAFWNSKKVIASDMETATLFTLAQLRGVHAASILNNVVKYEGNVKDGINDYVENEAAAAEGEKREILLALETIYSLHHNS
ncbi:nucleoside phosphorylase [Natronincola ferrireducens]|uniref:Uridine phosphorylase n=1 Tax=Natronincola ferrireducens TaxID=393762 RepID=A0A1G9HBZ9_9FIRM|nr:nucleoside phosphorylase [Natronincola ferrireducens]SDL10356.1 uridine phosphorylase [Natronincola ferrireducens]